MMVHINIDPQQYIIDYIVVYCYCWSIWGVEHMICIIILSYDRWKFDHRSMSIDRRTTRLPPLERALKTDLNTIITAYQHNLLLKTNSEYSMVGLQ